jgi:hypothetical protein
MTKRDIERRLSELEDDAEDDPLRVVINETVVGSNWDGDNCDEYPDEGESETKTTVIEIGGDADA